PARHVTQVERGRAGPPYSLRADHEALPEAQVELAALAAIVREAGAEQRRRQVRRSAHPNRFAIEARALAAPRGETFLLERVVDYAEFDPAAPFIADRDAELRIAVGEVGGAVERIDYPPVFVPAPIVAAVAVAPGTGA